MRAYEALHQLAERFAPMSDKSGIDLQTQSSQSYMKALDVVEEIDKIKAHNDGIETALASENITDTEKTQLLERLQDVPKENLEHKVVRFAEKWWVRYLISMLFVWVQPKIQNYLNPPPPEPEYEDEPERFRRD